MKFKKILIILGIIAGIGTVGCVDVSVDQVFSENENFSVENTIENKVETARETAKKAPEPIAAAPALIPPYVGNPYVVLNENQPEFTEGERVNATAFEYYSPLDGLGRCGVAYANICREIMPSGEREGIGMIKPSGWHTVKYNGLIDGNYLYNRCHLIAYQLAGENANSQNLITGTRHLNINGMLDFENRVGDYVRATNHHVLYRVTPSYTGNNLLADGVKMEAWSVEDHGAGICFNVFCYNVQPGIIINYATGDSCLAEGVTLSQEAAPTQAITEAAPAPAAVGAETFVLNQNTRKFHRPNCGSVNAMAERNKVIMQGTIEQLKGMGYDPCGRCLSVYR